MRRRATASRRKPAISPPQLLHHSGNLRQPHQRPPPPNLPRHRQNRVRASILTTIRQQESQFPQQLRLRQTQQRPDPRILQRRHGQSPPLQNRQQPSRGPSAKSALRIKKQPPSRVPPFPVRKLRCQRNHHLLPVGQPFPAVLSSFPSIFSVPSVSNLSDLCVNPFILRFVAFSDLGVSVPLWQTPLSFHLSRSPPITRHFLITPPSSSPPPAK